MAAIATTATNVVHSCHIQTSLFSCLQPDRISAGGSWSKSLVIIASSPKDDSSFKLKLKLTPSHPPPFNSQGEEDVKYVLKLAAGSLLGAAVIKYGSALFPQITTPNILLALSIISGPLILALLLLINKTRRSH